MGKLPLYAFLVIKSLSTFCLPVSHTQFMGLGTSLPCLCLVESAVTGPIVTFTWLIFQVPWNPHTEIGGEKFDVVPLILTTHTCVCMYFLLQMHCI